MPTELSTHEMTELLIYAAGNPIASSSLHTLGGKGLLVFDASSTPFWKLSPQGKETVAQEYKRKQETKDAILQAILDKRASVVNDALRVLSTYGVKAGIASGKITVNRMSNNTLRLHFEGTISRRLQQRLNECRFQYSSSGYWWHDDDDLGKKFLSEHLGADEFVGDDSESVEISEPITNPDALSNEERLKQWLEDRAIYGRENTTIPMTAIFKHPTLGSVRWYKNADFTYTRVQGDNRKVYLRTEQETPVVAKQTLNVMDKATTLEYEVYRENIARDTVNALETPQACEFTAYTPDNKPTHLSTARYVDCDGKAHDALILETFKYLVNVAYFDDDDSAQIVCAAYRELSVTDRVVDFTVKRMVMLQAMWKVMSSSSDSGKRWSEYGRKR